MNYAPFRRSGLVWLICLASLALVGCSGGDSGTSGKSGSAKVEGTYVIAKDDMKLVIQPEHKATMTFKAAGEKTDTTTDTTWEASGDDKIVVGVPFALVMYVLSDGNLRDAEGGVWEKK